jgi:hypothetical protein
MLSADLIDIITGSLSFLFTLLILSYVVGDNPAFRAAVHAFVGVSTGYIAIAVFRLVILDKMVLPFISGGMGERIFLAFPLVLSLLLLGKMFAGTEWVGRPVVAFLVGVGAAAAIGGAVLGTIFPQILATAGMFDIRSSETVFGLGTNLVTGLVALVGTIATLVYFQFTIRGKNASPGKRGRFMGFFALLGQVFIVITLGAIFAGVLAASLTAFVDRVLSVINFIVDLIAKFIP